MGLLTADRIFSGYGEKDILQGVSVRIEPSEIVTIIGPNGAGKSTFLKTLAGLLRPHQGEILFRDKPIHGLRPAEITRQGLCYVPQEENIFPQSLSRREFGDGVLRPRTGMAATAEGCFRTLPYPRGAKGNKGRRSQRR